MPLKSLYIVVFICCCLHAFNVKAQDKTIDSLRRVLKAMSADSNKVKTLRLLFIESIDKESADEAIHVAQEALDLSIKLNYKAGQAMAYKILNVGYQSVGNLEKAMTLCFKSLKIYEELHDMAGIGASYSNIGLIYRDENAPDDALIYFKKSLDVYSKLKNKPENMWRGYVNIGMTYEMQHKDTIALKNYLLALQQTRILKANQNVFVSNTLYHLANIYFNRKDYKTAKSYLTQAVTALGDNQEAYPASEIYILLSKVYIVDKEYTRALKVAQKGLALVKKENYIIQLAENYLQVAKSYAALKNYSKAYNYQIAYIKIKDSLNNSANIRKIEKLQYNYQLEKKERVNQELIKDKKLKEIIIQRQYAVGAVIGIGLLSLVLISVFYYRNFQSKKRDNELLSLQQQEILEQNQEILAQNDEISSQKEHLSEINNTKNKLFSIIAHDMRSPVFTLQEALTVVNDKLLTREEFDELSQELLSNVTNTSAMLDNILYWARSQMEGITLNKTTFNVKDTVGTNLLNFNKQATDKGINFINNLKHDIHVLADKSAVDLVVRNLISNAIKFCKQGDQISVMPLIKNGFVQLSIADTGQGISAEIQKKLFDTTDFYSTYGTANEKGTGLGLNLCHEFIVLHGGAIWVDSELGKGSTFTFTVPLT
jgi:two-component system sensor histidine kinase/response regulator